MATINRVNGLVSGFDTESLVKDLMKLEKAKTDKVLKDKQSLDWQKDAYKEMMSLLRGFQSDYLDILKPTSNLRSKTAFNAFAVGAKISGVDTTKVSVTTSSSSVQGNIKIDSITQLATKDTWVSGSEAKVLEGTAVDIAALNAEIAGGNKTIQVKVDGVTKSIDLAGAYTAFNDADPLVLTDLVSDLQSKLDTAFGAGKITVSGTEGVNKLTLDSVGSTVSVITEDPNVLGLAGFTSGESNVLGTSSTLASAFGVAGTPVFEINGVFSADMGITADDTIQSMMQKVNASNAGVTLSYSTLSNKFTMKANEEGYVNNVMLEDTDSFFASHLKIADDAGRTGAVDAELTINGVATTRSSNKIDIDGTTVQLKDVSAVAIDVTVSPNTAPVKDTIVKFVNRYNELIDKIYGKINEIKYRDFQPLTDEEKTAMSDDNVVLWETKAKSGLLKGDSILSNLMSQLRTAFGESVSGSGISLREMGIVTSSDYKEYGKLTIDETKLDSALTNKPSEVAAFFTQESEHAYGDSANKGTRYSENGLAARINDILNDSIRLTGNGSNQRGSLVEKAGYEKSSTDTSSFLAKKIKDMETRYATLLDKLNDTESHYYAKFTAMETALQRMNAQATSLASMLGGSSS